MYLNKNLRKFLVVSRRKKGIRTQVRKSMNTKIINITSRIACTTKMMVYGGTVSYGMLLVTWSSSYQPHFSSEW